MIKKLINTIKENEADLVAAEKQVKDSVIECTNTAISFFKKVKKDIKKVLKEEK